ncbi:hypothetical protein SAMN05216349_11464 [Oribacterium sp. KHPX15]|uniref:hypothetical protein n=1 Tax=Oribacterium sp. KHPX15 TaxID=1855342 RepID=UPI00089CA4CC|nr:hypothetical protein [Oribacterium sp. KHPX15]SEA49798.1 hypothetical protein SAMN05216349_11464 [Oribacterium sp. KHPX15]
MEKIICSCCGSTQFTFKNGYRICNYCETRYSISSDEQRNEIKASLENNLKNKELSSGINIKNDVERLLNMCEKDKTHASKYANLILDIDPSNQEALKYIKR